LLKNILHEHSRRIGSQTIHESIIGTEAAGIFTASHCAARSFCLTTTARERPQPSTWLAEIYIYFCASFLRETNYTKTFSYLQALLKTRRFHTSHTSTNIMHAVLYDGAAQRKFNKNSVSLPSVLVARSEFDSRRCFRRERDYIKTDLATQVETRANALLLG
jgi:hypothetical protein